MTTSYTVTVTDSASVTKNFTIDIRIANPVVTRLSNPVLKSQGIIYDLSQSLYSTILDDKVSILGISDISGSIILDLATSTERDISTTTTALGGGGGGS